VNSTSCQSIFARAEFLPAVLLLNVLRYYDPFRAMLENAAREGFGRTDPTLAITFVDPPDPPDPDFDWGKSALDALERQRRLL
jgi:hypothetical protein